MSRSRILRVPVTPEERAPEAAAARGARIVPGGMIRVGDGIGEIV